MLDEIVKSEHQEYFREANYCIFDSFINCEEQYKKEKIKLEKISLLKQKIGEIEQYLLNFPLDHHEDLVSWAKNEIYSLLESLRRLEFMQIEFLLFLEKRRERFEVFNSNPTCLAKRLRALAR